MKKIPNVCECGEPFNFVDKDRGFSYCQTCGRLYEHRYFGKGFWWRPRYLKDLEVLRASKKDSCSRGAGYRTLLSLKKDG